MPEKRLVIVTSATGNVVDGGVRLDKKFVAGMQLYAQSWDGPVQAVIPRQTDSLPFAGTFDPAHLPFSVRMFDPGSDDVVAAVADADVALISGDNPAYLHLADACKAAGTASVFTIENTLRTRLQIISMDSMRSSPRRLYSKLWVMNSERKRRAAFRKARGIQANGYPAENAYKPLDLNLVRYLDNRMDREICVTEEEQRARRAHLLGGGPLRLLHSGRLEPIKGSKDVVRIARGLRDRGVAFHLAVFGTGSLQASMRNEIERFDLSDHVTMNEPVDFRTGLVPYARTQADAFLSCNMQSDPSCTYVESVACGLPIFGYANDMWAAMHQDSKAGWSVPMGDVSAMVDQIATVAATPELVVEASDRAGKFGAQHSFEVEFQRRIDHLRSVVE